MKTCIYCRSTTLSTFPKEHVVPKAFGRFGENLTLDCVCGTCNSFFNRELEIFLARDSVEAMLRIRYGLKTKSGRRKLGKSRLIIRCVLPGDWYGARLSLVRDEAGTDAKAEPLPQVAFQKNGESDWRWFLEEELDQTRDWERYRTEAQTKIVGKPDAVVERLAQKLIQLGIVFKKRGEFEKHGGEVQVFAEAIMDDIIFRGVAKIAFNFLAHQRRPDFALRSDFDTVRDYIRFGVRPPRPVVIVTKMPILHGDDAFYRQTNGHLIVLDWDRNQQGIVCLVSLFNHMTYHVNLCWNYSGLWHPLTGGRHFDIETGTINEVRGVSL